MNSRMLTSLGWGIGRRLNAIFLREWVIYLIRYGACTVPIIHGIYEQNYKLDILPLCKNH
jgi:hypothetical protein